MVKRTKPAIGAMEILHRRFHEGKPARLKSLEEARAMRRSPARSTSFGKEKFLTKNSVAFALPAGYMVNANRECKWFVSNYRMEK